MREVKVTIQTAHSLYVTLGDLTVYFSYSTPIAFYYPINGEWQHIRKNDWRNTTGKHLNAINPDKTKRIDGEEFERRLEKVLEGIGQTITVSG